MRAFLRDPYALFEPTRAGEAWDRAPMAAPRQPVQYARPRLLVDLDTHCEGDRVERAEVDWRAGTLALYDTLEDAMCNLPSHRCFALPLAVPSTFGYANKPSAYEPLA